MIESVNSYFVLLHPKLVHFPIALFISAMGLEMISLVFKKDGLHRTVVYFYVLFVTITGHNGGRMVYEYGVGVSQ